MHPNYSLGQIILWSWLSLKEYLEGTAFINVNKNRESWYLSGLLSVRIKPGVLAFFRGSLYFNVLLVVYVFHNLLIILYVFIYCGSYFCVLHNLLFHRKNMLFYFACCDKRLRVYQIACIVFACIFFLLSVFRIFCSSYPLVTKSLISTVENTYI